MHTSSQAQRRYALRLGVTTSMMASSAAKTPQMAQSATWSQNTAVEPVNCSSITSSGMTAAAAITTSTLMRRFRTRPRGVRMASNPDPPKSVWGPTSARESAIGRSAGSASGGPLVSFGPDKGDPLLPYPHRG